jgi:hypothetical protein
MKRAGGAMRFLSRVTAKAGGPIEPASGRPRMRRVPAGAGSTAKRSGAAVAWRSAD